MYGQLFFAWQGKDSEIQPWKRCWKVYKALWCVATSDYYALCCYQTLRLPARDYRLHVPLTPQVCPTWGISMMARRDSFMLKPYNYSTGYILAIDRAYINYGKFEEITKLGVVYVTNMKKNIIYTIDCDTIYIRERTDDIQGAVCDIHKACKGWRVHSPSSRIIKYVDISRRQRQNLCRCWPMTWIWRWRISLRYIESVGR